MNKKGQFNIVEIGFYLLLTIIVAIFILIVAIKYLNQEIDTQNLENFILTKRLIDSDLCLAYNDGIRTHQGVIDPEKIDFTRLKKCFEKESTGFTVELTDIKGEKIKSAANLDLREEAYLPVCSSIKNYKCASKKILVSYYIEGKINTGFLKIEVIKLV